MKDATDLTVKIQDTVAIETLQFWAKVGRVGDVIFENKPIDTLAPTIAAIKFTFDHFIFIVIQNAKFLSEFLKLNKYDLNGVELKTSSANMDLFFSELDQVDRSVLFFL